MMRWLCPVLGALLALATACSDDATPTKPDAVDTGTQDAPGATDGPTSDGGLDIEAVTCPDNSTPDWPTLGSCKTFIQKVIAECCPKATNAWLELFVPGLVCGVPNANAMCATSLSDPVSFKITCDSVKTDPTCT